MITWIRLQQVGVNDVSARLCRWLVRDGYEVAEDDEIAELETSKALFTVIAERKGHLRHLRKEGEDIGVGAVLAAVSDTPSEALVEPPEPEGPVPSEPTAERRWTMKAALLANKHEVDIAAITGIGVIHEADVKAYIQRTTKEAEGGGKAEDVVDDFYGPRRPRLVVLGAGRGAVQVVDAVYRQGTYRLAGLLDDDSKNHGKTLLGVPILGVIDRAIELYARDEYDTLIISITNDQRARHRIYSRFAEAGIPFGNVIDPTVTIHSNVSLGTGNVILAGCRIGSCCVLGNNNFLSAYVNIEHHNVLGDTCTFGPGVMTSGRVVIGNQVKFGTGVFLEPGVEIGEKCIIASGSVLTSSVESGSIVKSASRTIVRKANQRPADG